MPSTIGGMAWVAPTGSGHPKQMLCEREGCLLSTTYRESHSGIVSPDLHGPQNRRWYGYEPWSHPFFADGSSEIFRNSRAVNTSPVNIRKNTTMAKPSIAEVLIFSPRSFPSV